jgi:hypothetical protein
LAHKNSHFTPFLDSFKSVPKTLVFETALLARIIGRGYKVKRTRTNLLKDYEKKNAHNAHNAHKCSFIGFDWVFLLTTEFEFGYFTSAVISAQKNAGFPCKS